MKKEGHEVESSIISSEIGSHMSYLVLIFWGTTLANCPAYRGQPVAVAITNYRGVSRDNAC